MTPEEIEYANKQADYMRHLMLSGRSKDDALRAAWDERNALQRRAAQAEQERDESRQQYQALMQSAMIIERERDADTNRADMYAGIIETLAKEKALAEQERDELRHQLEQAQITISQAKATIENLTAPRDDYPYEGDEMDALQREAAGL